jgi:hypothetical protein
MAWFLTWSIRVPAFLAGVLFLLAGAAAVVDWSLAFTGAAMFGFVVEGSGHFARKSRQPLPAAVETDEFIDEARNLQYRIADLERDEEDTAA